MDFLKFDGTCLKEWLSRCEQFFNSDRTSPEHPVRLACLNMEGIALEWYQTYWRNRFYYIPPWHEFKEDISSRFRNSFVDPRSNLVGLKQSTASPYKPPTKPPDALPKFADKDVDAIIQSLDRMIQILSSPASALSISNPSNISLPVVEPHQDEVDPVESHTDIDGLGKHQSGDDMDISDALEGDPLAASSDPVTVDMASNLIDHELSDPELQMDLSGFPSTTAEEPKELQIPRSFNPSPLPVESSIYEVPLKTTQFLIPLDSSSCEYGLANQPAVEISIAKVAAVGSDILCPHGVCTNAPMKMSFYCPPAKPPEEYLNVFNWLHSNRVLQYEIDFGPIAHFSVQPNQTTTRTCAGITIMELEVPLGLCSSGEPPWPPDVTSALILYHKLNIDSGEYGEGHLVIADTTRVLRIPQHYKWSRRAEEHPAVKHYSVNGQLQFKATLLVPNCATFDLFGRRVSLRDHSKEVLPEHLSFIKSMVDSEILPLSISWEMLQQLKLPKILWKNLVLMCSELFQKIAADAQDYNKFYTVFSKNLKLGIHEDSRNKAKLASLLRYYFTKTGNDMASFTIYLVSRTEEVDTPDSFRIALLDLSQFFDDDESIYGSQGMKTQVWVSSVSFKAYAEIKYESSSGGGKGIPDLHHMLVETCVEDMNLDLSNMWLSQILALRRTVAIAKNVSDFTIEEPLDHFQHVRTCAVITHLSAFNVIKPAVDLAISELQQVHHSERSTTISSFPSSRTVDEVRKHLKINKKCFLSEVLSYLSLHPINYYMDIFVILISDQVRADIFEKYSGIGAAIDMDINGYLRQHAWTTAGKFQLFINSYAKALEIIARQLFDNAKFDASVVIYKLGQMHSLPSGEGTLYGDAINTGGIAVSYANFVWEPSVVHNAINATTGAACLVSRVTKTKTDPTF